MDQRFTIITLSVSDLAAARAFYSRLGWVEAKDSNDEIAFYQIGSMIFSLYPRDKLAVDVGIDAVGHGFSGVTLSHNVDSETAVDSTLKELVEAGASLVKAGEKVFWGGYSGYIRDPDGHLIEVAFNPFWAMDDGRVTLA